MSRHLLAVAPPRARRSRTRQRNATAAYASFSAAVLVLVTACQDTSPTLTAPPPPEAAASKLATGGVAGAPGDPLSARLSSTPGACLVAVRTPQGRYLSRSTAVLVPAQIARSASHTARFAYRGWAASAPEPVLLAVCTIPDSPSARAYFQQLFGGKAMTAAELTSFAQSAKVGGVQEWGLGTSPQVMQGAGPVYMTDGLASLSPATRPKPLVGTASADGIVSAKLIACAVAVSTDPGCGVPEEETVPAAPPPDDAPAGAPNYSMLTNPTFSVSAPIYCYGSTDYPHLSTTYGYFGRLNVKSQTQCPIPLPQYVTTTLKRESCWFWIFCSWPQIAWGINSSPSATYLQAIANTDCRWQFGWYRGEGYHRVAFPEGIGTGRSPLWNISVGIRCW